MRKRTIRIVDEKKTTHFVVKKAFFASRALTAVNDGSGKLLGFVRKRHWWSAYSFDVLDARKNVLYTMACKLPLELWTYRVRQADTEIAIVKKKWSGLGKEMFTQADTFSLELAKVPQEHRPLFLGAVFLIDLLRFEHQD
jgi:uncharacterized protein YxjI